MRYTRKTVRAVIARVADTGSTERIGGHVVTRGPEGGIAVSPGGFVFRGRVKAATYLYRVVNNDGKLEDSP